METLEAILTRRSIRKFTEDPVSDNDLNTILKSAMNAPSACNEQPWHFIVVRSQEMLDKVARTSAHTGMAAKAPVAIVICGDLALEKAEGFWVQDCSAAIENLMLAARSLELGTVWCGVHPVLEREEHLRQVFGLPRQIRPFGIVCIGHPAQKFHEEERFRQDRIHTEKW